METRTFALPPGDDSILQADPEWTVVSIRASEDEEDVTLTVSDSSMLEDTRDLGRKRGQESEPTAKPGQRFALRTDFKIRQRIGGGGQGEVFEARQRNLNRTVAVKIARKADSDCDDFFSEAYTTALLDHPNVIPIHDIGLIEDERGQRRPVLTMKRVRGKSWLARLRADRSAEDFQLETFLARHIPVLIQVTHALDFAHSRGIIHRDLKPSQIMVGSFGEVYLLDWGLGLYVGIGTDDDDDSESDCERTALDLNRLVDRQNATNPTGTPAFMAPEQAITNTSKLGIQTDVYLVGATLYYLVMGRPPHQARTAMEAMYKAAENSYPPLPPEAPQTLVKLIEWCMEIDPEDRPESAALVRSQLEDWLTGAGRMDESRRLVEEVAGALETSDKVSLSECARKLERASHLWPENHRIAPLRDDVLARYVGQAIERGDLVLAVVQARRVSSPEHRATLFAQINEARERQQRELPNPPLLNVPRTILLLLAVGLVLAAFFGVSTAARTLLTEELRDKAMTMANFAAESFDPEELRELDATRDMESPVFASLLQRVREIRGRDADIAHVTALRQEFQVSGDSWRVIIDADPYDVQRGEGEVTAADKGMPPGTPYWEGNDAMREAYFFRRSTSALTTDRFGEFISGYAPVRDPGGERPVAIIAVDIEAGEVYAKMRAVRNATLAAWLVVSGLIVAAFLAFFHSRRSLARVRLMEERINHMNRELEGEELFLG